MLSMSKFVELNNLGAFEGLLKESDRHPILLFKHSLTCSISSWAYKDLAVLDGPVMMVVVQNARALSNEIASRTGIKHESPQAIVLRNGRPVWSGSHGKVTAAAVTQALQENK